MMKYIIHRENELKHYGVPGTKWGVRRYQNKDGSYKPGAEGRYYEAVKANKSAYTVAKTISDVKSSYGRLAAKLTGKTVGPNGKTLSNDSSHTVVKTKLGSAGGSSQTASRPINKTIDGKDINVKDASEKIDTSENGSKSSSKKKTSSKKTSSASSANSGFKVSELTDKIENFFDMDNMTDQDWEEMELSDSDISELDDLISKYKQWRGSGNSKTKKLKKIDEFIERYEAWKSSHSKHSEPREEYLQHFGILGMKWGIRRYQNEDGTYTRLGKLKRKLNGEDRDPDYNRAHKKDKLEYLSTEELKARNDRLNTENNYLRNIQQNAELRKSKASQEVDKRTKSFIDKVVVGPLTDYAASEFRKKLPDIINAGKNFYKSGRSR